jgi:hypothetical protein
MRPETALPHLSRSAPERGEFHKGWVPHPFVGSLTKGWDTTNLNPPIHPVSQTFFLFWGAVSEEFVFPQCGGELPSFYRVI